MAADASAARRPRLESPAPPANAPRLPRRRLIAREPASLDNLIHHRVRLGIVSALAAAERLTFNEIKALLQTTDGNLSVHARKLEEASYVMCIKGFDGRRPRTQYQLTARGRRELTRYLTHMEALIRATWDTLTR
jgi:DNA-binding MarR family transcriptional regulator